MTEQREPATRAPFRSIAMVLAMGALLGLAASGTAPAAATVPAITGTPLQVPETGRFLPLPPARVLDTRIGLGAPQGRPISGAHVRVQIAGYGGIPASGATAVTLDVVVTNPEQAGYVQVVPSGTTTFGGSSSLNVYAPEQTTSNLVTVPLGPDGAVVLYDVAGGDLVADALGYFEAAATSTSGRYVGLTPSRVLDTRLGDGTGGYSVPRPAAATAMTVQMTGRGGVPSQGVSAVAFTVTADQSAAAGFVQAVPAGGPTPLGATSNVNLTGPDQTVANLVIVPVGAGGAIQLYNSSGTHLIVDVVGYFTDSSAPASTMGLFVPLSPARLMDSRAGGGPVARASITPLPVAGRAGVPVDGVSAAFLNATTTATEGPGYLQLYPAGRGEVGTSSSLNFTAAGQTVAGGVIATLGDLGAASIFMDGYTGTHTQIIVDVSGYFTGPAFGPVKYTAWAWGHNAGRAEGIGANTDWFSPSQTGADTRWSSISAGGAHTVALKTDGTLWAWGADGAGQLGDGSTADWWAPERIGNDTDWAVASAGGEHTVALKSDGTLWTWGNNGWGQLGSNPSFGRSSPGQVGSDAGWVVVSAGLEHTVALRSDGTLWSWGRNSDGQLGDGTTTTRGTPAQVGTGRDWAQVAAGPRATLALKTDGTLWAWGYNNDGELGDGTTTSRLSPVQVGTDNDWRSIAAGAFAGAAVKTDGTLWTWGYNGHGALGDGTTVDRRSPGRVGLGASWTEVSAGVDDTMALTATGALWVWGRNVLGSLGDGTVTASTDRLLPEQIGAGQRWASVSAGRGFAAALSY